MMLAGVALQSCGTPNPDLIPYAGVWEPLHGEAVDARPMTSRASMTSPDALIFEPAIEGVSYALVSRGVIDHGKFGYVRFEAGTDLPPQAHFGELHFLVLEGALSCEIAGEETLRVEHDGCLFVPSRTRHALHIDASTGALCYVESNAGLAYFVSGLKATERLGQ